MATIATKTAKKPTTKKPAAAKKPTRKPTKAKVAAKAVTKDRAEAAEAPVARRDIAQTVTDRILTELENGSAPWVKPWRSTPGGGLPRNFGTGRPYTGTNVVLLWIEAQQKGYTSNRWLTYNQAEELGGHVRKGEHGTLIVYMGKALKKDEAGKPDPEGRTFSFLKGYRVFNECQCEGLPEKAVETTTRAGNPDERNEWAEAFIRSTLADYREGLDKAFYQPVSDFVGMPKFEDFVGADNYYATAFHELGHWTGHARRMKRDLSGPFGSKLYAQEELVAELTAAFLCAEFGFDGDLRHAAYIGSWIKLLKEDKNAFMKAASAATKASEYLRGLALQEDVSVAPEAIQEAPEAELAIAA